MTSRSERDYPLLSAALRYAERGWLVFPLYPRSKKPIKDENLQLEYGFKDASNERNTVLQWWQGVPNANIGLATGDPFDVLDIDGPQSVSALQDVLGKDYRHHGPVVTTGKGKHLYFAALPNGRNRAGLLGGKLDYRGTGGYVVAPPSIHPSGRVYEWDHGRDDSQDLPLVPEALHDVILRPNSRVLDPVAVALGGLRRSDSQLAVTTRGEFVSKRPPILDVCAELGLVVRPMGQHHVTNCLFHPDPGPSMVLYINQDKFHCYGCEAHGDSFDLRDRRDMTGREAI